MNFFIIIVIRVYQILKPSLDAILLSVFGFAFACKHSPTCSQYTILQIQKHGTITGLKKGFTRVLHCH